jgi:hypothetical protein
MLHCRRREPLGTACDATAGTLPSRSTCGRRLFWMPCRAWQLELKSAETSNLERQPGRDPPPPGVGPTTSGDGEGARWLDDAEDAALRQRQGKHKRVKKEENILRLSRTKTVKNAHVSTFYTIPDDAKLTAYTVTCRGPLVDLPPVLRLFRSVPALPYRSCPTPAPVFLSSHSSEHSCESLGASTQRNATHDASHACLPSCEFVRRRLVSAPLSTEAAHHPAPPRGRL